MSKSRSFEDQAFMSFIMYYYVIPGGCESWDTLQVHRDHFTFLGSRCFLLQVYKRAAMHGLWNLGVDYPTLQTALRDGSLLFI